MVWTGEVQLWTRPCIYGSNEALETTPRTGRAWCSNREGASKASDALGLGVWRCRHVEPQAPRSGAWGGSTSDKVFDVNKHLKPDPLIQFFIALILK